MPTLRDVARACGVSHQTVSNVLNDAPRVRPETRARVLAAIQALDYQPNVAARGLAGKGIGMLGVVFSGREVQGMVGGYNGALLEGIFSAAGQAKQEVVLFTRRVWEDDRHCRAILQGGQCDGLLLVSPHRTSPFVTQVAASQIPCVLINDLRPEPQIACVDIDNEAAAAEGMRFLLGQGHRRIAIAAFASSVGCNAPRLAGCRRALAEAGVEWQPRWVFEGGLPDWDNDLYEIAMARTFGQDPGERPTALFAFGDSFALYGMTLLRRMGLRVPQDVSVMGFNDELSARLADPPLTTIHQPLTQIGALAAELLLAQMRGEDAAGRREILPHRLVIRGTVVPPVP